jgi:hypothetical protein
MSHFIPKVELLPTESLLHVDVDVFFMVEGFAQVENTGLKECQMHMDVEPSADTFLGPGIPPIIPPAFMQFQEDAVIPSTSSEMFILGPEFANVFVGIGPGPLLDPFVAQFPGDSLFVDSFVDTVSQIDGCSNNNFQLELTGLVEVTVEYTVCLGSGSPPEAFDDHAQVCNDTSVLINVVANDHDADGDLDSESVLIVAPPMSGFATNEGGGVIRYTPAPGFSGVDALAYIVHDFAGNPSAPAHVIIQVDDCTDCPTADAVTLWPPNHDYHSLDLNQLLGGEGTHVFTITSITQDEPINSTGDGNTVCDGYGVGGDVAMIRAERKGNGNGRVYAVNYSATTPNGNSCGGTLSVTVPHSQNGDPAVDDGQTQASDEGCGN